MEFEIKGVNQNKHGRLWAKYLLEKDKLLMERPEITSGSGREAITWKVRGDVKKDTVKENVEFHKQIGIRGFDFEKKNECADGKNSRINFLDLLIKLWPGDWKENLKKLNESFDDANSNRPRRARKIHHATQNEFWVFFGILLIASIEGVQGGELWKNKGRTEGYRQLPNLDDDIMKQYRFKEIKKHVSFMWADDFSKTNGDPWWQVIGLTEKFNKSRRDHVHSANEKVGDETMSAHKPRTTAKGKLPHISFIKRKPEPLGTELKSIACSETKIMLGLEIQRGKDDKTETKYIDEVRLKTSACTMRLVEATCQRLDAGAAHDVSKNNDATNDCFLGDSWFGSVPTALGLKRVLQHPTDSITQIKTAHARYPKKFLESAMKNWPGGSYLVMEGEIDGDVLYAVGYKYCKAKTLCFLFTEGASSTEPGEPYRANWKDENGNSMFRDIPRPECCARYFLDCNIIDVLNQMRQKELRLEKYWVTHDGFFRLIVTVFGICVVDVWNGYKHHLAKNHRHKKCELMEMVNMMAKDLIENRMSEDLVIQSEATSILVPPAEISTSSQTTISPLTAGLSRGVPPEVVAELESMKHFLIATDEYMREPRMTQNARTQTAATRNQNRKRRYACVECKAKGNPKESKTVFHCSECRALDRCKAYWLCTNCLPGHRKRIRSEYHNRS